MRISDWSSDVCSSDLRYSLLDGHLRVEVLKDLGITEVECLVAADDDTYTYNKRINRLAPIQEHRMIQRAIDRGVPRARIADALGLEIGMGRGRGMNSGDLGRELARDLGIGKGRGMSR